jgi:hypothetical protein
MKKQLFPALAAGLLLNLFLSLSALAVDRINITAPPYNAVPNDGVSDNTAINAAVSAGRSIYFPPGTYNYTGLLYVPANQSYRFYGDGPGVSTIIFTGNSSGGIYGYAMGQKTLTVEGLTLQANTTKCGTAIQAFFSDAGATKKFKSATIRNVQIVGSTRTGYDGGYWTGGIRLYQAQNSVISNVEISGNAREGAACPGPQASVFGIIWDSASTYPTSGLQISNIQIKYCDTALRTNGWVENLFLTGFEFVLCGNNGSPSVDLNSSDAVNLKSTFHLVNGHVDALQNGLRLTNLRGVKISKVLIVHSSGNSCASSGTDLALNNVTDGVISQCTFVGVGNDIHDEIGIRLNNAHFVQVTGNYFTHMLPLNPSGNPQNACINVQSNSSVVRIVNNLFESPGFGIGGVNIPYYDAGPGTYYRGNNR